jgi:8-oxo-dGTP diphosphatase
MNTVRYVVGFLFNSTADRVVLIKKDRPDWQAGKLNGVGGKIEAGESPAMAMVREFKEEAGITITDWNNFAILSGRGFETYFFYSEQTDDRVSMVKTMETEEVIIVDAKTLDGRPCLPNLNWLIPMALSMRHDAAECFLINERYYEAVQL